MKILDPLVAGPLRITWLARGDRVGHRIDLLVAGTWTPLLESCDDVAATNDAGPWPTSPPLSDWHCEARDNGTVVALGVGQAAKGHWSAAIELFQPAEGQPARIAFDVACRASRAPGWLGSQYVWRSTSPVVVTGNGVQLAENCHLRCDAAAEAKVVSAADETRIVVVPRDGLSDPWPRTVRWQYGVECAAR